MRTKSYTQREFERILKKNQYYFLRWGKGDHRIYSNGSSTIVAKFPINKMIALRLIKEYELMNKDEKRRVKNDNN